MKHHTSQPRVMLCRNDWLRPLLSSGFACLIPVFRLVFPLSWFLLSSLVLYFRGVPTSRSLLFIYQPSPSKTHDTTSALWGNREQNLLFQVGGQTFIIWLYITSLLNYFSCVTTHRPLTTLAALFPVLLSEAGTMRQGGLNEWEDLGTACTLTLDRPRFGQECEAVMHTE